MHLVIIVLIILAVGIWIGFLIGFSRAIREAAKNAAQQKKMSPAIKWIVTVMGGCLLVACLVASIHTWQFTRVAQRADGVVIELRQNRDNDGGMTYAPTFRFQDAQGTSHTINSTMFRSHPAFRVGETVKVLYRADKPDSASIDSFMEVWGLAMLLGLIGGIEMIVGVILFAAPKISARFKGAKTAQITLRG